MKQKEVIVIIPYLSGGGAERAAINLAENIKNDYNLHFVLFDADKNSYDFDKNIKIINLNIKASSNIFGKALNTIKKYFKIKKIKKELKVDVSISFLREPNFINVITRCKKEKIIISVRNKMSELDDNKLKKFLTKYAGKKADKVVALSKMVKKDQIDQYGIEETKIEVIYNACDTDRLERLSNDKIDDEKVREILENNKGKLVINIGRLTYQKGQHHLIKAFSEVVGQEPEAKLIILGKGELKKELQELIYKLKLENNVLLLGFFDNPYKFMKKADIFVFSSMFEGLGNILLEAMACGLPIISTDCEYGPREIIAPNSSLDPHASNIEEDEYGVLVPVCKDNENKKGNITKQEEIMARAIINLLNDKEKRMQYSKKSLERIKYFSMDKNKKEWEDVIENI